MRSLELKYRRRQKKTARNRHHAYSLFTYSRYVFVPFIMHDRKVRFHASAGLTDRFVLFVLLALPGVMPEFGIQTSSIFHCSIRSIHNDRMHEKRRRKHVRNSSGRHQNRMEFIFSMEQITNSYPTISKKRKLFGLFVCAFWVSLSSFTKRQRR